MAVITYSRMVTWAKVILPLVALGVLSTIFLVSRGLRPEDSIPFADVDVEELAREQRITAPAFAGVTRDGTAITVSADHATPDPADPGRATAERLRAVLETRAGERFDAEALSGRIDTEGGQVVLEGGLRFTSSQGFEITAERLTGALDDTRLSLTGPIEARAPFGELSAGTLDLGREGVEEDVVLHFRDGVRVLYQPASGTQERP